MPEHINQKWAMSKLGAGDWCLPANEASGVTYRLVRWDDGPELGAEHAGTFWAVYVCEDPSKHYHRGVFAPQIDESIWYPIEYHVATRRDAIQVALRHEQRAFRDHAQAEIDRRSQVMSDAQRFSPYGRSERDDLCPTCRGRCLACTNEGNGQISHTCENCGDEWYTEVDHV